MSDGRLVSGFEGQSCAADHCHVPLTDETGAYLHKNRENGKLCLFCEACSTEVQLNHSLRLPLVAL
jgi:hypothetical protein